MTLTPQQVVEILERLRGSECETFHLHIGDATLDYRRNVEGRSGVAPPPPARPATPAAEKPQSAPAAVAAPEPATAAPTPATAPTTEAAPDGEQVLAPMGGVFYRRPSPEEPTFVEEGTVVGVGDPLCVIEVMKLFSTVHSEVAGRVVAIHVDDAQPVEQNQPLFTIEPAGS